MKIRLDELRRVIREVVDERPPEEKYAGMEDDPYIAAVIASEDPTQLGAAKREYNRADKKGLTVPSAGAFFYWYEKKQEELKSMGPAAMRGRADLILRQRTSSGRAIPRKF
jgi:hypothetical protein